MSENQDPFLVSLRNLRDSPEMDALMQKTQIAVNSSDFPEPDKNRVLKFV